ncbi:hypothetical protein QR680_017999 [Steinernema hermaphroditum]|uniref:Saposin B-type domain-containing protein n=1 Tax=Steinernema hermaphroditum TaxID=289476 RepID=A0AA39HGJ7_9BILA|nr:hypothetical protein QR680_017999 [Steinernema hermaphroditum]
MKLFICLLLVGCLLPIADARWRTKAPRTKAPATEPPPEQTDEPEQTDGPDQPDQTDQTDQPEQTEPPPTQPPPDLCPLCKKVVGEIEKTVEKNQNALKGIGKGFCKLIFKKNPLGGFGCELLVGGVIDNVERDIKNKEKPEVVCFKLKMCEKKK